MQTPEPRAPSMLRLLLALTIFVSALLAGVFFIVGRPLEGPGAADEFTALARGKKNSQSNDTAFFYSSIGHAPAAFNSVQDGTAPGRNSFTLEIKVATTRDEAERVIDDLHEQGVEAYYTPLTRAGRVVYRIRQGIFASQKDADRAALAVHRTYALEPKVVKLQ